MPLRTFTTTPRCNCRSKAELSLESGEFQKGIWQLLAETGYDEGDLHLNIVQTQMTIDFLAEATAAYFEEVGIDVSIVQMRTLEWNSAWRGRELTDSMGNYPISNKFFPMASIVSNHTTGGT